MPGFLEIPFAEIVHTLRMPERGTESKESIVTDVETVIARPAVKEMVASGGR